MWKVFEIGGDGGNRTPVPGQSAGRVYTRSHSIDLGELSREEARLVADYLKRDVRDVGQHLAESRQELREWFRFDVEQVEARLWEAFAAAADRTGIARGLTDLGSFARSIIEVQDQNGLTILDHDEYMRPGTDMQALGSLNSLVTGNR